MNGGQRDSVGDRILEPDLDLDGGWLAMVILGATIIVLFGFCFCISPNGKLVPSTGACMDHWRSWEMGAVLWAILFGVYYFARFPQLPDVKWTKAICALVFLGSIVSNSVAAYYIFEQKEAVWHVGAVIAGGVLFMVADYLLYKMLDNHRKSCSFFEGLLLADAPMVIGLAILMVYLLLHPGEGKSHEEMEAFAGGAISFQLIAANVIFVLCQGGFIRWVWLSSDRKSDPRARQKAPLEYNLWAVAALPCGLFGSIVPLARLVDGSWSALACGIVGLAAIIAGVLGRRAAERQDGAGKGPATVSLVLGVLGLFLLMSMAPQGTIFSTAVKELAAHPLPNEANVRSVAVSPDGSLVARGSDAAGPAGALKVFNVSSESQDLFQQKVAGPVLSVAFSPDGKILASGGNNLAVHFWDTESWNPILRKEGMEDFQCRSGAVESEPQGDAAKADVLSLAFSPEGKVLAGGASDNSIRLWDTESFQQIGKLQEHGGPVQALAFSADGKWLVSGGDDNKGVLWSVQKRWLSIDDDADRELCDVKIEVADTYYAGNRMIKAAAISRHGEAWAAGLDDGSVLVWERKNPHVRRLSIEANNTAGSKGPILALRFSDDALFLASASKTPGVQLWDVQSGRPTRVIQVSGAAAMMDLSQDGGTLVGGSEGDLNVWWTH